MNRLRAQLASLNVGHTKGILNFGRGAGRTTVELWKLFPDAQLILGCDISRKAVEVAVHLENLHSLKHELVSEDFSVRPAGEFDVIDCFEAIKRIFNLTGVITMLGGLRRPVGYLSLPDHSDQHIAEEYCTRPLWVRTPL